MYGKTAVVTAGTGGAVLAFTGFNSAVGIIIGIALLTVGGLLVRMAALRRRRI